MKKIAFLNGELDEKIYMDQLLGFEVKRQERKLCKLHHVYAQNILAAIAV